METQLKLLQRTFDTMLLKDILKNQINPLIEQDNYIEILNIINSVFNDTHYSNLFLKPIYKSLFHELLYYQMFSYNSLGEYKVAQSIYNIYERDLSKIIANDLFYKIQYERIFSLSNVVETKEQAYNILIQYNISSIDNDDVKIKMLTEILNFHNAKSNINNYVKNFEIFENYLDLLSLTKVSPNSLSDFYIDIADSFIKYRDKDKQYLDLKTLFVNKVSDFLNIDNLIIEEENKIQLLSKFQLIKLQLPEFNQENKKFFKFVF